MLDKQAEVQMDIIWLQRSVDNSERLLFKLIICYVEVYVDSWPVIWESYFI